MKRVGTPYTMAFDIADCNFSVESSSARLLFPFLEENPVCSSAGYTQGGRK